MGLSLKKALQITGLTRHQYYYKSKVGKRGIRPSETTQLLESEEWIDIPNESVVKVMEENHRDRDLRYGYKRMSRYLQQLGFKINHKKVYRIMKEADILQEKKEVKKQYVRYRLVQPEGPLEVIEMDIKFIWVEEYSQHAYVLTILDTFTRKVLEWTVGYSITQYTVKDLWTDVIVHHLQPNDMYDKPIVIEVRNDNDPRFSAKKVQQFFEENHLGQVFTHPYTPQENGHIESFHAILGRAVEKEIFYSLADLEKRLIIFYEKYNNVRLHGSLASLAPQMFWEQWEQGNIERKIKSKNRVSFRLKVSYYNISGKYNQREVSGLNLCSLDESEDLSRKLKELDVKTLKRLSV